MFYHPATLARRSSPSLKFSGIGSETSTSRFTSGLKTIEGNNIAVAGIMCQQSACRLGHLPRAEGS